MSFTEPLACVEQKDAGPFPHFIRVLRDTSNGKIQIAVSEQGLLSPVAKVEMTRDEAARFFHAAWAALIYPED